MYRHIAKALLSLALTAAITSPAFAAEFRVPIMTTPPTLDGKIGPTEWANAVSVDGFGMDGQQERRRVKAYIGATEDHFYFAIVSQLPADGALMANVKKDTTRLVFDDSVEIFLDPTPNAADGITHQIIANSIGNLTYVQNSRGIAHADSVPESHWKVANSFHDGYWVCELSVPIQDIGAGRRAEDGVWGMNLGRDWKNQWAFSSLDGQGYKPDVMITFAKDAPAIHQDDATDSFSGNIQSNLSLSNPTTKPLTLVVTQHLVRDLMPETRADDTITLQPGEKHDIPLAVTDRVTKKFDLATNVTSADGKTVYYARDSKWALGDAAWTWVVAKKVVLPVDFQFAYYPYSNKMRINADVSALPANAHVTSLTATIRNKVTHSTIKTVEFKNLVNHHQEVGFNLPPLNGSYEIAIKATGENVPAAEVVKPFERTVYPWEHNPAGRSAKVYTPFVPLAVAGKHVSAVLRDYTMNDQGLWDQVLATSDNTGIAKNILAAPIAFHITQDGHDVPVNPLPLAFTSKLGNQVVAKTAFHAGALGAHIVSTMDYDGLMRVDLTLLPTSGKKIDTLDLDIPFDNANAPMIHAMSDGIRNTISAEIPKGEGTVWTAAKVAVEEMPKNFCTYLYVGSPVRGICWFTENDRNWSWDHKKPNLELIRKGGVLTLRVHLIDVPVAIAEPRTITFGMQAAPVKPRLKPWRDQYYQNKYQLVGTDINWMAAGDCASVYPAGKDISLWDDLHQANLGQLPAAERTAATERVRGYMSVYGKDVADNSAHYAKANLGNMHKGAKMILYYNRASYQGADEFQTFQDEWICDDSHTTPAISRDEIKIIPSESYIDHALYWYGKAFDSAGSAGVYWDNYFFNSSFNTRMTNAYNLPDGTIQPSTGIWGLRELAKRTTQFMNERGMMPVTQPHMTSTSILPMLSYATMQLDWEWHYGEGDVQDRFSREYILLATNGELAGVWPVVLGDQGKLASDPWTQRTFAGVSIVHELNPRPDWQTEKTVWQPLITPIFALETDPNVKVYRYWDDRPLPVTTGDYDLPSIVYSVPGKQAIVEITGYAPTDKQAAVTIDAKTLGFVSGNYKVTDIETGADIPVQNDQLSFPFKKHDLRELRIEPK